MDNFQKAYRNYHMKYKIAVCDDEQNQLDHLSSLITQWSTQSGHVCELHTFLSAESFLFEYAEDKTYDILLLDIEMKGISGIDLAKRIRRDKLRAEIVFITSHFEFFGEGYEVDALHYLIKPLSLEKLAPVLFKAVERLSIEPPSVVISCDNEVLKLYESEIFYVEAFLHYITIHTAKGTPCATYRLKESLSSFQSRLSLDFYRVHRSYLVSLKHVVKISRNSVTIENGVNLPLARGKYDDIHRAFIERN